MTSFLSLENGMEEAGTEAAGPSGGDCKGPIERGAHQSPLTRLTLLSNYYVTGTELSALLA